MEWMVEKVRDVIVKSFFFLMSYLFLHALLNRKHAVDRVSLARS
jgi:hypothetical protein